MPKLRRPRSPASSSSPSSASHHHPRTNGGSPSVTFTKQTSFAAPPDKRVFLHPYKVRYPRTTCKKERWPGSCSSLLLGVSICSGHLLCSTHTDSLIAEAYRRADEEEGGPPLTMEEMHLTRGQFVSPPPPYFDRSTACQSCDREWCEPGVGAVKRGVTLVVPETEDPGATFLPAVSWFCHDCAESLTYHLGQLVSSGHSVIQRESLETRMTEQHFVPDIQ